MCHQTRQKRSHLYTHSYIQFHFIDNIAFLAVLWFILTYFIKLLMRRIQLRVLTYEWSNGTIILFMLIHPCV